MFPHHGQFCLAQRNHPALGGVAGHGEWNGPVCGQHPAIGFGTLLRHRHPVEPRHHIPAQPRHQSAPREQQFSVSVQPIGPGHLPSAQRSLRRTPARRKGDQSPGWNHFPRLALAAPRQLQRGPATAVKILQPDRIITPCFQLDPPFPALLEERLIIDEQRQGIIAPAIKKILLGILWQDHPGPARRKIRRHARARRTIAPIEVQLPVNPHQHWIIQLPAFEILTEQPAFRHP